MCVVDHDGEGLALINQLETPRHTVECLHSSCNGFHGNPFGKRRADRPQCVIDIETACQSRLELVGLPFIGHFEGRRLAGEPAVKGIQIRRLVAHAVGVKIRHLLIDSVHHHMSIRVIHIHPRCLIVLRLSSRRHLLKKDGLGFCIVVHRLMVVQMIFREVREDGIIKFHAFDAPHDERMRRNLHAHMGDLFFCHLPEQTLQIDDIRCGIVRRQLLIPDQGMDGADDTGLVAHLLKDMAHDMGRGGLAIRPRKGDHAHLARRIVKEKRYHIFHRFSGICHIDDSDPFRCLHLLGSHDGFRPQLHSRVHEFVSIHMRSLEAKEKAPLFHLTRVRCHIQDLNICSAFRAQDRRCFQ